MKDVSIICVENNKQLFDELFDSLKKQKNVDYKLIDVDNSNNLYQSAWEAFKSASDEVEGKYTILLHQDIRFIDDYSLNDIIKNVEKLDEFGVVGIAGAKASGKKTRKIYSCILHGEKKEKAGLEIDKAIEVQTVDECLFCMKTEEFLRAKSEYISKWHLYAVEVCLDYLLEGRKNYVVPARIWHMSNGKSLDTKYMYQLEELIKVYKAEFPLICTTVKAWNTDGLISYLYRRYYILKQFIKRKVCR